MPERTTKIALICFDNPFLKPMEGGKRSMLTRIQSLAMLENCSVDVYLLNKPDEGTAADFGGFENRMRFFQYTMNRTSPAMLLSRFPICVRKRYVSACAEELKKHEYDAAIYEGEQVSAYRIRGCVKARRHILYFHDIESEYRKTIAQTADSILKKLANRLESRRFKRIEKRVGELFDTFWFISKDECAVIGSRVNKSCVYLPAPALETAGETADGTERHKLLYVGDLRVTHNFLSLKWFVDSVMPRVKEAVPDVRLEIAGRIREEDRRAIERDSVRVLGYVDDLDALYNDAASLILPVLYGAGVKVKVIDALGKGQIVITTGKGIEGTELENGRHLLASDSPDELTELCIAVLKDRDKHVSIAEAGFAFVKKYHSVAHQAMIVERSLHDLLTAEE